MTANSVLQAAAWNHEPSAPRSQFSRRPLPRQHRTAARDDYGHVRRLTGSEKRFLEGLADGATNKEMARRLSVSPNTVKFHLKNLYVKLGVNTRLQAVSAARGLGLLAMSSTEHHS